MTNTAWPAIWARLMADVQAPKLLTLKSGLGRVQFESRPHIFNVATKGLSKEFAQDERHPLHLPSVTNLMDFDHGKFHWRIKIPVKLFPKAIVRNHATRKARNGIVKELKRRGYDEDGRFIRSEHSRPSQARKADLKGAMAVELDQEALAMSQKAVERSCQEIVDWVILSQKHKPAPSRRDRDDRVNHPFKIKSYLMAKQYVEDLNKGA